MVEERETYGVGSIFRDIRRYFCDYCGICRSKKSLIASHILTHHPEEMNEGGEGEEGVETSVKTNTCEECGATFKKPAHLRQHMQSHSLERPYTCPVDNCHASYRREDHLTRHSLQHKGKLFECSIENCNHKFAFQGNLTRHVKEFHGKASASVEDDGEKQLSCTEPGCGKAFKYPSRLQKHMDSHFKLDSDEAMCLHPGCFKQFSNEKCLRVHVQTCHQYIICEICGSKQLKKNIKRHLISHEPDSGSTERVKCEFKGCTCSFSTKTNLKQHIKAVHLESRPFACGFSGCDKRFSHKHVRDKHEQSSCHVFTPGDFEEADEQFRSRNRGGRKRKFPSVEMLVRKRITPPTSLDECHPWLPAMDEREDIL